LVARALHLSTGVAGAWIGTSEFADAAGLAAAQTYGGYAGHVPGIAGNADAAVSRLHADESHRPRCLDRSLGALCCRSSPPRAGSDRHAESRPDAGEIWRRFPKFVLGFLLASAVMVTLGVEGLQLPAYKKEVLPGLVAPLQALRTWAFTFRLSEHRTDHEIA
jgi:hypothetical protein